MRVRDKNIYPKLLLSGKQIIAMNQVGCNLKGRDLSRLSNPLCNMQSGGEGT